MNLKDSQKGISIYLAIIVMFVLLGIGLGISTLLVGQIKTMRGMAYSVVAIYTADTGVERELSEKRDPPFPVAPYYGYLDLDNDGGGLTGDCSTLADSDDACYKVEVVPEPNCAATGFSHYIRSTGVYKGVRRAIELSIPVFSRTAILDSNYVADWVTFSGSGKSQGDWMSVRGNWMKSLIKWNIAQVRANIGSNKSIQSATLYVYEEYGIDNPALNINLLHTDDSWNSTWAPADLWLVSGPLVTSYLDPGVGWVMLGITSEFKTTYENSLDDFLSFNWKADTGMTDPRDRYTSPFSPNTNQKPYITVTYRYCP